MAANLTSRPRRSAERADDWITLAGFTERLLEHRLGFVGHLGLLFLESWPDAALFLPPGVDTGAAEVVHTSSSMSISTASRNSGRPRRTAVGRELKQIYVPLYLASKASRIFTRSSSVFVSRCAAHQPIREVSHSSMGKPPRRPC